MPQDHPFDRIIHKVDKGAIARLTTEKLLIVEKKKKETRVLQKSSVITSILGGDLSYYIVANNLDASNVAEDKLACTVRDFNGDRSIDIIINYQVRCPSGREEDALYSLCVGNLRPADELENQIRKWVAEYSKSDGNRFIDNYLNQLPGLRKNIESGIQQETGLSFQARITLDRENELQPFIIQPTSFSVRVVGCDDALDLQIHTELVVDEPNKIRAILKAGREFELANLVKDGIRKYLREHISIQQFYSSLNTSIRNELVEYLNSLIVEYGRRVNFLTLSSNIASSAPVRFEEIRCPVDCEIHDPELIAFIINNTLQLELKDVGKYRVAQTPNLEQWAKEQLTPVVKAALFQKKYIEVLLKFDEISETIKKKVAAAAEKIGYSVEQIVSIPKLDPLELTKDFDVEIEQGAFTLRDPKVEVRLNIVSTLRISNLQDIENDLSPTIKLKELMKKEIQAIVRRFLNQVEPERFYMRFSDPDSQLGEPQSVEEELRVAIENALKQRFKAQVSGVVIRTLDTEIKLCYERLFEQVGSFELEFNSFKDGKPVYLCGDFQINGVEQFSWYTFQARRPSLESIQQCVQKSLHSKVSNLPSELLTYNNVETQVRLEQLVEQVATDSVVKQFGLKITVSNVSRKLTELEILKSKAEQALEELQVKKIATVAVARDIELSLQLEITQASSKAKVAELKRLLAKREEIISLEDNDDELEELNAKIAKLQAESPSGSIGDAEELLKSMRMKETDANHLLGFSRQVKSLTSNKKEIDNTATDVPNDNDS